MYVTRLHTGPVHRQHSSEAALDISHASIILGRASQEPHTRAPGQLLFPRTSQFMGSHNLPKISGWRKRAQAEVKASGNKPIQWSRPRSAPSEELMAAPALYRLHKRGVSSVPETHSRPPQCRRCRRTLKV